MPAKIHFLCCFFLLSVLTNAAAQDPDIDADERSVLEDIYRSSDHEGEIPTAARDRRERQKKRVSVPEGARRVGCLCMNGSASDAHSAGACSGQGGVRYWLYRTLEGDTVRVLTARHERHPQALDSLELSETNRARAKTPRAGTALQPMLQPIVITPFAGNTLPQSPPGDLGWFDWSDAAAITGGGFAIYFILRLLLDWVHAHQPLVRYALRHLLRFGKRPASRPNRKTPGKTGL